MWEYNFYWVTFGEDGDTVDALYDGEGKCVMWGDYYHNHIRDRIEGFLRGVSYTLSDPELPAVWDITIPDKEKYAKDRFEGGVSPPDKYTKIPKRFRDTATLMQGDTPWKCQE